jgi:hypothetical protein
MNKGYDPQPIDTSAVELPPALLEVAELLARNAHDVWAQARMADGWRWGPARNDASREHPMLRPYEELPESEKDYDRRAAQETLKAIMALGFQIGGA